MYDVRGFLSLTALIGSQIPRYSGGPTVTTK